MVLRGMVLLFFLLMSHPAQGGEPGVSAAETEYDFGEIVQGAKASHTFVFRNSGDADLIIDRVRSSCGCTAALLSSKRLPPGAEGELEAVFDAGRFRGAVSKEITLYTNVPQRPQMKFVVRATVRPEIELSPEVLDTGTQPLGESREMQVSVTNRGDRRLDLGAPRATHPEIETWMDAGPLAPGESRILTVRVSHAQSGGVNGYVLLRAEGAAIPEVRLPVYVRGAR